MIRPNEFTASNREDDLLQRLKHCVGSLQTTAKDHKRVASSTRQPQAFASKQMLQPETLNERKYESRPAYRQSLGNKQNMTDVKYHTREQDFRRVGNDKENVDIVKMTKNYLQSTRQNARQYQTDRKQSIPLAQKSNLSNIKRELFSKEVSDSTKKRIAERESLINGEGNRTRRNQLPQKAKSKAFDEDEFLQRLSLRKLSYCDQPNPRKEGRTESARNTQCHKDSQGIGSRQLMRSGQSMMKEKSYAAQQSMMAMNAVTENKAARQHSQMINRQKYQNYSKIAMQNLVKDQDMRKAQKIQKLKKITNMNDQINKKIRKIVDTFQNYLTHRQL